MTDLSGDLKPLAKEMLTDLYGLIEALGRCVPRLERVNQAPMAQDAADLRRRALHLMRQIEGSTPMQ